MKFHFKRHPAHCVHNFGMHTVSIANLTAAPLLDVYSESGQVHLGFVAKAKRNPKQWVAGPKTTTRNVVLKRGFKNKEEAAEYLYAIATFNAI